ncbi:hypothetical protein F5878DRAFT_348438 [Lentinula raphanica]|uniref:Peptidase S9 prolyl oligopeptidase catalytic domain-containing protein n=1 Tax=Lentinula raphanica TaxID=153919 RepID=A0AA38PHB1_9AGAR|nr:hypothetical protein F5878DRAFT_348438 [Lentinula raphanica]
MLLPLYFSTLSLAGLAHHAQMPLSEPQWRLKLSTEWAVLGPFPIHAREQHFLEPSFPIDVKAPVDLNASFPSAYADGGSVTWSFEQAQEDGTLEVSFPDVRWKALRDTEGWAALQHHAVLKSSLTVYPTSGSPPPYIRVQLVGGSYFTIIASDSANKTPRWYSGNIYDMERALPRVIDLPEAPSLDEPTTYDIFVSGDYEIRLFGDPRIQHDSETPVQTIKLQVDFDDVGGDDIVRESTKDVIPDVLSGWTFGNAIGIGLRARNSWWSVQDVHVPHSIERFLSLKLPQTRFRLAPTQARIFPLAIVQHQQLPPDLTLINATLILQKEQPGVDVHYESVDTMTLYISLPITHLRMWDEPSTDSSSSNPVIKASYFFGVLDSIPTNFLVIPPKSSGNGRAPILALHGAGVDIFSPNTAESFWPQALPRQDRSWVVIPSGRTSWGLDWHGPSAEDAWGSLDALTNILRHSKSTVWGENKWDIPLISLNAKPKAIVMGHSNGGQGAWHIAERFPDRVLGVIPASAYIKSQSYVPWTMSRSAHFADPVLEAILQSSLTPDDNDLFVGNLQGKDVLAIHGGDDENVPVWHSRELVGVLQSLQDLNTSRVELLEFLDQPHWFPSVLNNDQVQSFIDHLLNTQSPDVASEESFTMTVAIPAESNSMRGWHVEKLFVPGRLGRVHVRTSGRGSQVIRVDVETTNILEFSVDPNVFDVLERDSELWVDGKRMQLDDNVLRTSRMLYLKAIERRLWKISSDAQNTMQLSGRMQTILSSPTLPNNDGSELGGPSPLVFVIPDSDSRSNSIPVGTLSQTLSIALRLSHDLFMYHQLDSEIMLESEVNVAFSNPGLNPILDKGNIVVVGNGAASGLQNGLQSDEVNISTDIFMDINAFLAKVSVENVGPQRSDLQPGQGVVFLHPHPNNPSGKVLFLQSTGSSDLGLERATRLFPIRTGVPVPDWIIVGEHGYRGEGNVAAAGVWDSEWNLNRAMSWSSTA